MIAVQGSARSPGKGLGHGPLSQAALEPGGDAFRRGPGGRQGKRAGPPVLPPAGAKSNQAAAEKTPASVSVRQGQGTAKVDWGFLVRQDPRSKRGPRTICFKRAHQHSMRAGWSRRPDRPSDG